VIEQAGWRTAYVVQGFVIMLFILPFSLFLFRLKPSEMDLLPYGYEMDNIGNAVPGKSASVAPKTTSVSQDSGVSAKVAMTSAAFIMVIIFIGTQNIVASGYDAHISAIGISYGLSAGFGALLVSSLQVGSAFGKFAYGFVSDLIGAKNATYITIVGIILGLFGMLLFRNPYLLMGSVFLFGLQDTLGSVASPLILKEIFGNRDFVTLFAWMRVGFGVFGAVAAPLVGLTYDLMGTYELALYMGLALCALILTSLALAYRQGRKLAWEAGKDDCADFKKTG
jgi:MFS family permease